MNCPPDQEISAYADHMLAAAARAQLAAHLPVCARCRQRLEAFNALQHALQQLPSPPLGFDLAAQWQSPVGAQTPPPTHPRTRSRQPWLDWRSWGGPGLAAALSITSGLWLGSLLLGAGTAALPTIGMVRVFDPVPPGGLCAAAELCRAAKGSALKGMP